MKFENQIGKETFNQGHDLANKANDEFDKTEKNKEELELVKVEQNSDNDAETVTPELIQGLSLGIHDSQVRHNTLVNEAAQHIGKAASESLESESLQQ